MSGVEMLLTAAGAAAIGGLAWFFFGSRRLETTRRGGVRIRPAIAVEASQTVEFAIGACPSCVLLLFEGLPRELQGLAREACHLTCPGRRP